MVSEIEMKYSALGKGVWVVGPQTDTLAEKKSPEQATTEKSALWERQVYGFRCASGEPSHKTKAPREALDGARGQEDLFERRGKGGGGGEAHLVGEEEERVVRAA